MRLPKIYLPVLITLLATVSTPLPLNLRPLFPTTSALAQTPSSRKAEADRLLYQGVEQSKTGQFAAALQSFQQALTIYREIHDRQGERKALTKLGFFYQTLRDWNQAIEYWEQCLVLTRELHDRDIEATALDFLVSDYLSLKKYSQALEYQQQSLALARQTHNRQKERLDLESLARIYGEYLGNAAKAIEYLQQSLAYSRETHDRDAELDVLIKLGKLYSKLGDYDKLISLAQQVLAIAREIPNHVAERTALELLGSGYLNRGEYNKAIHSYQQMLAITRQQKHRVREWQDLETLGDALFHSGNLREAEKTLREGIQVWESLRDEEGGDERQSWSVYYHRDWIYRLLQKVLVAQNKTDAALEISERGRARGYMQLLQGQLSSSQNARTITTPTIKLLQQIAKDHSATLVEYSIIRDDFKIKGKTETHESELFIWVIQPTGEVAFRKVDLKPLWQQQNTSLADLVLSSRKSIGVRSRGNQEELPFQRSDLVKRKDDPSNFSPREVVAVNVQQRTVTLRFLDDPPDAPTEEVPFADVTEVFSPAAQNRRLQQLHQLFIQAIADLLPNNPLESVIFIPHWELFAVPFPALQDADGNYLIQKHTILTAPAIQVLELTRQQRLRVPGNAKDILVVGNPTMPEVRLKPLAAPEQLSSLKGSEQEAVEIATLLKTKALIGSQATKIAVVQQMPQARIVHLATHGLLDYFGTIVPGAVALAPSGNDSGLLTAGEILELKLNAELVVLSACNTGQGDFSADGVVGLSRALIGAGVPSIVVSLWYIPDAPTASLMTEFYRNLQKNPDKAQALRQAMLTTMKQHPNPGDWAAFTLIGEPQ